MSTIKSFEELIIWQEAIKFANNLTVLILTGKLVNRLTNPILTGKLANWITNLIGELES